MSKTNKIKSLIKYPGGKQNEINAINLRKPEFISRYFEPFVGGGAVYFSLQGYKSFINDKSAELISFYRFVSEGNIAFFKYLELIQHNWDVMSLVIERHSDEIKNLYSEYKEGLINESSLKIYLDEFVTVNEIEFNGMMDENFNRGIENFVKEIKQSSLNKLKRMKRIEQKILDDENNTHENDEAKNNYKLLTDEDILKNIEAAFKAAFYNHFRYLYNNIEKYDISSEFSIAIYFFIREYCFSSMFRYGPNGNFNVPYGGISYNKKSMNGKIKQMKNNLVIDKLQNTIICNEDFEIFLQRFDLDENDFVFIDPPYDTEFSTYAENIFGENEHIRLANYLKNKCNANFMMVIKESPLIKQLYVKDEQILNDRRIKIESIKVKYFVSFKNRNIKETTHLFITNY